ncbi:hypothetical protein QVD99_000018 [Batrachochytrium dendrobatidis]|nr:hypothetical protein QVD99_000018 [Batrachochytrium dendrobatidis]
MENIPFYIQYLHNQPVKVETHFNGELERRRPLTDVGGLVAAIVVEPTRRLAGIPEDYGPLTLHYVVNGVETNYNSWDPIAALGTNGTVGSSPLIIKSRSGTGQGVASSVPGAPVGANIRLVSGTFEETTNPSLLNWRIFRVKL